MRVIQIITFSLFAVSLFARGFAAEPGRVSIRGILVVASEKAGEPDRRLGAYERNLRQNLPRRFNSVRLAGEGRAQISVPGEGSISLGQGHSIGIEVLEVIGGQIHMRVTWRQGGRVLINTVIKQNPKIPFFQLGSATNDSGEVFGVLVVGS